MDNNLLNLELRVLLLRYGRSRVIEALAQLGEQSLDEVQAEITAAEQKPRGKKRAAIQSATEIAAELAREKPEISDALQALAAGYDNRTFLPQLRDVQRFLQRTGTSASHVRSRRDAARPLVIALSRLGADELNRIVPSSSSRDNDYALLAREIIGQRSAPKHDTEGDSRLGSVSLGAKFVFRTAEIIGQKYASIRKPPYEGQVLEVVGFKPRNKNNVVVRDGQGNESLMPVEMVEKALRLASRNARDRGSDPV
jgi:hypothetical protein